MATVTITERSRKSGKSYIIQYIDPTTGKKVHYKTMRLKNLALSESRALRIFLETGVWPDGRQANLKKISAMTFQNAAYNCEEWWKSKLDKGKLSPVTYAGYLDFLKRPKQEWGNRLMGSFTQDEIEKWHAKLTQEISPAIANRTLFVIKQTFDIAFQMKAIHENPAKRISYSNEAQHERKQFMKPQGVEKLVNEATTCVRAPYMEVVVALAVEHGASRQEVLSLKWVDIDFDDGPTGTIRFFRTKNKMERIQDIMPRTRKALFRWREYLEEYRNKYNLQQTSEYVICRPNGNPIKSFRKAWENLRKKLDVVDFHFHDNRHTYCTNVLYAGGSLKDVKEMIGHKTLRMTERYTGHDRERERIIQQLLMERYAHDVSYAAPGEEKRAG